MDWGVGFGGSVPPWSVRETKLPWRYKIFLETGGLCMELAKKTSEILRATVPTPNELCFFCGVGLIHWVCTYAGASAWAPLSSKCLRERFSLLGAYAGCLRRVLSPTLVTSGDSKIEELYNPQVVARCDRVTSGSCLQGVYSFATDGQIDFVSSRSNYSVEAAAHKQRTTSRKQEAAAAAAAKQQQKQQPSSISSSSQ